MHIVVSAHTAESLFHMLLVGCHGIVRIAQPCREFIVICTCTDADRKQRIFGSSPLMVLLETAIEEGQVLL